MPTIHCLSLSNQAAYARPKSCCCWGVFAIFHALQTPSCLAFHNWCNRVRWVVFKHIFILLRYNLVRTIWIVNCKIDAYVSNVLVLKTNLQCGLSCFKVLRFWPLCKETSYYALFSLVKSCWTGTLKGCRNPWCALL